MTEYKIGIDVGGTFTDFLLTSQDGISEIYKVLSTPEDPSLGLMNGLSEMTEARDIPLREFIKEKLLELRDPWTGEQVVDKVMFKEDIYSGSEAQFAPDLIFVAKEYAYLGRHHFGYLKMRRPKIRSAPC